VLAILARAPDFPGRPAAPQRAYTTRTTQLSRDVDAEMTAWADAERDAISVVKLVEPTGTGSLRPT